MIVESDKDLRGITRIGQLCGATLQHMLAHLEPGITTRQLDAIGAAYLQQHNAQSAPILAYQYPGWTCISVNEAVAHGVPDDTVIQAGDVVNIDVSAVLEGYWGDTGASTMLPPTQPKVEKLFKITQEALYAGIEQARAGKPLFNIGKAIYRIAKRNRLTVLKQLNGHGVGRHIHEDPTVFNFYHRQNRLKLREGMVMTIEPFFSSGRRDTIYTDSEDGWTLRTLDHSLSAQFEHTVVIRGIDEGPLLVTKVDGSH